MVTVLTRQDMEKKLRGVFPEQQADNLVEVLDSFREMEVQRSADTQALKDGLCALTEQVNKLAGAVDDLAVGQKDLTLAQQQTDLAVKDLAVAQQRTDQTVRGLAVSVDKLAVTVHELGKSYGSLSNTFGFSYEEFVAALLPPYLERHNKIVGLTLERGHFDLGNGRLEEVDLTSEGQCGERTVRLLVECRTSVGGSEVRRLAEKLSSVAGILAGQEVIKMIVGMNIHPSAGPVGEETGVWVIPYSAVYRER